jgi:hypothetical protein
MKTPDIRRIDFEIPIHWTGEQALAVFELLDDMREKIRAYYGRAIAEQMAEERGAGVGRIVIDEEDLPF